MTSGLTPLKRLKLKPPLPKQEQIVPKRQRSLKTMMVMKLKLLMTKTMKKNSAACFM